MSISLAEGSGELRGEMKREDGPKVDSVRRNSFEKVGVTLADVARARVTWPIKAILDEGPECQVLGGTGYNNVRHIVEGMHTEIAIVFFIP
jgi:hypothetical protein